jgi:hypothetical protein
MRDSADIATFIQNRPEMVRLLEIVGRLCLPDAWIGAGFVRNAVWDALTFRQPSPLNDIDVVYFDRGNRRSEHDAEIALVRACPGVPWTVKNQARMHVRNGDAPYRDSADAIAHWPETATAVAANLSQGRVNVIAPHGVADLFGLIVRPTPAFAAKLDLYRARIRQKNWRVRWPELTILHMQ